jgi:signal transduction histidine kinase
MRGFPRETHVAWASVTLLGLLCCGLAVLQYRWIGEVTGAERIRLHTDLQARLDDLSRAFNRDLASACLDLIPSGGEIEAHGREAAYSMQYARWRNAHERVLARVAIAVPEDEDLHLLELDLNTARFSSVSWPESWAAMHQRLIERLERRPLQANDWQNSALFEFPRFARGGEQEWLVVELNTEYLRGSMIPELVRRHVGPDYDWQLGESGDRGAQPADGVVGLLSLPAGRVGGPPAGPSRWQLLVRYRAGSLETIVARTRRRNLAISAAILLLMLGCGSVVVSFSRQAQQLADLQMNFVAGVSHELRTPLTVIRTAAYNLRGRLAARPDQVERYGALIQNESEKLTELVEQVLRFAGAKAGHVIRGRDAAPVKDIIDEALRGCGAAVRAAREGEQLVIERHIAAGLPPVFADTLALRHALQNLIENAFKYGTEGSNWVGVFAEAVGDEKTRAVEIRIADHGPGIPADEQAHIFDAFFRGRRALQDQMHGTGLGLNLVKMIIEAHEGTIRVKSAPGEGTEFIVRIPAAAPEPDYEFSHSTG